MSPAARTLRAALLASLLTLGAVIGIGVFLGFPAGGSAAVGVVGGVMTGGLLLAASRRAATFHAPEHMADDGLLVDERATGTEHDDDCDKPE